MACSSQVVVRGVGLFFAGEPGAPLHYWCEPLTFSTVADSIERGIILLLHAGACAEVGMTVLEIKVRDRFLDRATRLLRKAWRAVVAELDKHERMTPQELRDDGWDIK